MYAENEFLGNVIRSAGCFLEVLLWDFIQKIGAWVNGETISLFSFWVVPWMCWRHVVAKEVC